LTFDLQPATTHVYQIPWFGLSYFLGLADLGYLLLED